MWEQYRKLWIPTQCLILSIATILMVVGHLPFLSALIYVAMMEIFAIFGAAWSVRLRRKIERANWK